MPNKRRPVVTRLPKGKSSSFERDTALKRVDRAVLVPAPKKQQREFIRKAGSGEKGKLLNLTDENGKVYAVVVRRKSKRPGDIATYQAVSGPKYKPGATYTHTEGDVHPIKYPKGGQLVTSDEPEEWVRDLVRYPPHG